MPIAKKMLLGNKCCNLFSRKDKWVKELTDYYVRGDALMSSQEKYNKAFTTALQIGEEQLGEDLVYESIPSWDSVGHMELVAAIEDAFDIMMDTDDIIDLSSYEKGKEILAKTYGVEF